MANNKVSFFLKLTVMSMLISSCSQNLPTLQDQKSAYSFTTEDELQEENTLKQLNEFYNEGIENHFYGIDSIPIYYKIFKHHSSEKGAILISTGRTESAIKYKELIYDLYQNGYSVYIHDHRGQGLSGRMAKDREIGHIDVFQNYVSDMKIFYQHILLPNKHSSVYLLAHSMGGAIGLTYLQQFTKDFKAAAFSSPMLGLGFIQCSLGSALDKGEPAYAPTQKGYLESKESFDNNTLTNSKTRFSLFYDAYKNEPQVRLGGVSLHWINESCNQFQSIFNNVGAIKTPSLIFSAEEEEIVDPKAHLKFVEKAKALNAPVKGYFVKHAKHELLIEKDRTRSNVLSSILDFYKEHP
jgi:lysophospholipase